VIGARTGGTIAKIDAKTAAASAELTGTSQIRSWPRRSRIRCVSILAILEERVASPREISDELDAPLWAAVPGIVKQATVRAMLTKISGQVNRAAQSGGFERSKSHLSRTSLVLDQRGWNELATKFDRLLADFERIKAAAEKRLAAADHAEEVQAVAVMMLFESSPDRDGAAESDGAVKPAKRARTRGPNQRANARAAAR
jgi:hypothetical protein